MVNTNLRLKRAADIMTVLMPEIAGAWPHSNSMASAQSWQSACKANKSSPCLPNQNPITRDERQRAMAPANCLNQYWLVAKALKHICPWLNLVTRSPLHFNISISYGPHSSHFIPRTTRPRLCQSYMMSQGGNYKTNVTSTSSKLQDSFTTLQPETSHRPKPVAWALAKHLSVCWSYFTSESINLIDFILDHIWSYWIMNTSDA